MKRTASNGAGLHAAADLAARADDSARIETLNGIL